MISPTGKGVRNDSQGLGHYRAPRKNKKHLGTDFISEPYQLIVAPFDMLIESLAHPSTKHPELSGISFYNEILSGQMFYFNPEERLIGHPVKKGTVIGSAQDLKPYYGEEMISHIHLEIESVDPMFILQLSEITRKI